MANLENGSDAANLADELRHAVAEKRGWFIALGVLLVVLGLAAILFPFIFTIAAKKFLGWLFLIGGVAQIIHSFSCQRWSGFLYDLLIGILYVIVGGWLAFFPLTGVLGLTVLLALGFLMEGVLEFTLGLKLRPADGWVWIVVSGVVSIAVSVLLFTGLPGSAAWAIGLMVGVNLISSGWSFIGLANAAGKT